MINFKKVLPLKSDEEIEKMTPKEKEEYEKGAEKYYKEKVKNLSDCCKKFEDYLKKHRTSLLIGM